MNKLFKFILSFVALVMAISCNNIDDEPESGCEKIDYLTVTYEGKTYESVPTKYDSKGDFIFLDTELAWIYENKISKSAGLSTLLIGENEIVFYKNLNELLADNNLTLLPNQETRAVALTGYHNLGIVELWDDKGYKDTYKKDSISAAKTSVEQPNLGNIGFNDKCSSLKVTNNLPNSSDYTISLGGVIYPTVNVEAVFIGYDDKTFSDRSIVCLVKAGSFCEHSELPGFNDKMSSYRFLFAQKGQYYHHF